MSTTISPPQRRLEIEGTHNVRDLGGYPTADGHQTRWRVLLRSDKLDRLEPAAQQALRDYGVRTVVDLRYGFEVESEPDVFAREQPVTQEITYLHMPLYELIGEEVLPDVPDDLEHLYRMILDHRQEQIRLTLATLARPGVLPALVHCTAGKDRTGLIIALVLGAVGVPGETIVADYMLSARYLDTLFHELRAMAKQNGYDSAWYERLLICQPETMARTLDYVDLNYGGIPNYLLKAGLTPQLLASLRAALVE